MAFDIFNEEEKGQDPSKATPTLEELLKRAIHASLQNVKITMPAKVVKYNHKEQTVDVQPVFKTKYSDGKVVDAPQIYKVPLAMTRAGRAFSAPPLKKGHNVMLHFADRSLEKWMSNKGEAHDPDDTRMHDLSDAIAYPGGNPSSDPVDVGNPDDYTHANHPDGGGFGTEVRIKENGQIQILNKNYDFVKLVYTFLQLIVDEAVVYTSNGPQKLSHARFESLKNQIKTFVTEGG